MRSLAAVFLLFVACSSSSAATKASADAGTDAAVVPAGCVPCAQQFPDGLTKFTAARKSCLCTDDICGDACGPTQCAHNVIPADEACTACLDDNEDKCVQPVESTCEADADCTHYVLCHADSKCG